MKDFLFLFSVCVVIFSFIGMVAKILGIGPAVLIAGCLLAVIYFIIDWKENER